MFKIKCLSFACHFWGKNTGSPKMLAFLGVRTGSPKTFMFLGQIKMAAQNVNFVACGQVGFPHGLLLVANEAVPL
jgi:hypothetical protein